MAQHKMKSGVIIIGLITIIPNVCYSDENTLEFHCPERITDLPEDSELTVKW
jgi:hypothetical protein